MKRAQKHHDLPESCLVRALCLILALVALVPSQARAQPLPPDQACSEIVKTLDRITGHRDSNQEAVRRGFIACRLFPTRSSPPPSGNVMDEKSALPAPPLCAARHKSPCAARVSGAAVCLTLMHLPARPSLGARLFEMDALVHVVDPRKRNEMVLTASIRIILRQLDLIPAFQTVHGADVHAV